MRKSTGAQAFPVATAPPLPRPRPCPLQPRPPTSAARPDPVGEEAESLLQLQGFQGLLGYALLSGGGSPGARVCGKEDSQQRRGLSSRPRTPGLRVPHLRGHTCAERASRPLQGHGGPPRSPSSSPCLHPRHRTPISGRLPPPGPSATATSPCPVPQSRQVRSRVGTWACPPDHFPSGSRPGSETPALDECPELLSTSAK